MRDPTSTLHRRSLLAAGIGASMATLSGCQRVADAMPGRRSADDIPGDTGETLDSPHRLTVETVRERPAESAPVELAAAFENRRIAAGDPARLRATLRNVGDAPVTVEADPPWPFGVPFLLREDTDEFQRVTAWNDAFAESEYLRTRDRAVVSWEEGFVEEPIDPGETITEAYELYHDSPGISAGTFSSWVTVRAKTGDATDTTSVEFDEIVIEPIPGG